MLIDTSGSMSLDEGDVESIIEGAPTATLVAIYSGREKEGQLRVVARDGRRASPRYLSRYGIGNIVDLPALKWLAAQRAPRIWISDGGVTGVDDTPSAEIEQSCHRVCRRARIRRVKTVKEAAAALLVRR